ncbi:hypothetical protein C8R46DRAFT_904660 [Mycena filopes]|nr:hypothetical protein C8R46DRAFT_904660 [Mycena filopes]
MRKDDKERGAETRTTHKTCPVCSKHFARPSGLQIHLNTHTGATPFSCPCCQREFNVKSNMHRHLRACRSTSTSTHTPAPRVSATRYSPLLTTAHARPTAFSGPPPPTCP